MSQVGLPLQTHRIEEFIRPDDFSGWNDHWVHSLYMCVCIYIYIYIYSCGKQGLLSRCGAQAFHYSGFSCGAEALGHTGFSKCGSWAPEHRLSSCGTQA